MKSFFTDDKGFYEQGNSVFPRVACFVAYLCVIGAIAGSIFLVGWGQGWSRFGIVALEPKFADFRSIQGALASELLGLDPRVSNPGDPWGRLLNYPHLWVDIGRVLNIGDESNFILLCSLIILGFVACCIDLLRRYPSFSMLVAVCSGAALLGVERCNNDLVVFVILYTASFLYARGWFLLPLMLACLLKIFPLFVLLVPLVLRRWAAFFTALFPAIVACVWFRQEILQLKRLTPGSAGLSYGVSSLSKLIGDQPWSYAALFVAAAAIVAVALRRGDRYRPASLSTLFPTVILFLTGGSIYVGTYLFASNWDYRLIFLIFCVPHLLTTNSRWSRWALVLALIAMNFQIVHALKTRLAIGMVNLFDLGDFRWVELFRIPFFVADHAVKAILCCLLLAALLRCLCYGIGDYSMVNRAAKS